MQGTVQLSEDRHSQRLPASRDQSCQSRSTLARRDQRLPAEINACQSRSTLARRDQSHTPSILSFLGGGGLALRKPCKEVTLEEQGKGRVGRLSTQLWNHIFMPHFWQQQKMLQTPHQSLPCNITSEGWECF